MIAFHNLILEEGDILALDSELSIHNSGVIASVIYLMDFHIYAEIYAKSPSQHYHSDVPGEGQTAEINNATCSEAFVTLMNVSWQSVAFDLDATRPLDAPNADGIQVKCDRARVNIHHSFLADNEVFLQARRHLQLHVNNSTFQGQESGNNFMGGILIDATCSATIIIEYSQFTGLKYYDLVSAQFALRARPIGAVSVQLKKQPSCSSEHAESRLLIRTSRFLRNFGALAVHITNKLDQAPYLQAVVEESVFEDNEIVNDGGALYLRKGDLSTITINNCVFLRNRAGVIPSFSPAVRLANHPVLTKSQTVTVLAFDDGHSAGEIMFYTQITVTVNGVTHATNRTVLVKHQGAGGAICSKEFHKVVVNNCTFIGNYASAYGGTIYSGTWSHIHIQNSVMTSPSEDLSAMLSGGILASYGPFLSIARTKFYVETQTLQTSAITHGTDASYESVFISDISVQCPVNTRLIAENISQEIFHHIRLTVTNLSYVELVYICDMCKSNTYSMEAGYFEYAAVDFVRNGSREVFLPEDEPHLLLNEVTCHECPYGGNCAKGVHATRNMWGVLADSRVAFYNCPPKYCCTKATCPSFNHCQKHRTGTLCGRCRSGYSEQLFSTNCVPNGKCRDYWFLVICVVFALLYALFLLFQNDIKNLIIGIPRHKTEGTDLLSEQKRSAQALSVMQTGASAVEAQSRHLQPTTKAVSAGADNNAHSGIFLILLFYYFQDASLVVIDTPFGQPEAPTIAAVRTILSGLFRFQLDVMHMAKSLCVLPNLTPVTKLVLRLSFVPCVFLFLLAFTALAHHKSNQSNCHQKWKILKQKSPVAVMLAVLFSHQKIAWSTFTLQYCVPVHDMTVLFVDGNVRCMQAWQFGLVAYGALCIIPFSVYISLAPAYLADNTLSTFTFFIGCIFPLPALLCLAARKIRRKCRAPGNHETVTFNAVHSLLQGPYQEVVLNLRCFHLNICWSGILLLRRMILILLHTYNHHAVSRQSFMLVISAVSMLLHLLVWPCKEMRANFAATVSNVALVAICVINLIRAIFIIAKYTPQREMKLYVTVIDFLEDLFLFWIPLVGMCIILGVLLCRLIQRTARHLRTKHSQPLNKATKHKPQKDTAPDSRDTTKTGQSGGNQVELQAEQTA